MTRPYLWGYFFLILLNQLFIFILVFVALLPINFLLTSALLMVMGPFSHPVVQVIMVQVSQHLALVLGENYVYKATIQSVYDFVLNTQGYQELTTRGKYVKYYQRAMKRDQTLMNLADKPATILDGSMELSETVLSLIILLVAPVAGAYVVIVMFSISKGVKFHERYFELKGLDYRQQKRYTEGKWVQYMIYGIFSGLLTLLPVLSAFFTVTNICGAALWSVDIEVESRKRYRQMKYNRQRILQTQYVNDPFSIQHAV